MARYLLGASPIPGHVLPMLRIGADLRRRGHMVELLTSSDFHDLGPYPRLVDTGGGLRGGCQRSGVE
ncbi:MAG: hypothetical protein WAW17_23075, partial [Rhodococcus sp. (in: high G+C Gram-positive bacteria)]|uniref:hypothetical protein n=1 Tax=Rhodococcus sp. TaxID=1831 RepID=UPI003BB0BC2F